ncbi:MAG: putative aldouronate transport system substrate-binding protein [Clostridiales bacterium]|jgi:putative aldouronate transport system substrate-binding protein|nr:putative aldouronate transport system substrate-binding protein [Clostridiales bacterium]
MKRLLVVGLCLVVLLSFILSACGQQQSVGEQSEEPTMSESEQEPTSTESEGDSMVTEPGTFPIAKEKVTLRVFCRQLGYVSDYVNNEFTKWYEEKTNVHIEWDVAPEKDVNTKLNLILAGGDYPDMFIDPWAFTGSQVMAYGSQGVLIPLNDLIDKYGVEIKKAFNEYPMAKEIVTMPNGNIYTLPQIDDCFHCQYPSKMWVYQPWLDKLGLKEPTTTDEFYQVLKAFKEQDPNGNGKADEIPFAGTTVGSGTPSIAYFMMNSFIYTDSSLLRVNNGKVESVFDKPEWKEGLQYLHKLYSEGLLAAETFTQDNNQLAQLNGSEIRIGFYPGLTPWGPLPGSNTDPRWVDYKGIAPLEGPHGVKVAQSDLYNIGPMHAFAISKSCKYPAVAFRWADALYNQEFTLRKYYGRPDQEWRYAKSDEIGINGEPAIWASLAKSGAEFDVPTDKSWAHIGPHYRSSDFRLGQAVTVDPAKHTETVLYNTTKEKYEPYSADIETILPPLVFTEQQSNELLDLETTIKNYVNEMFARFIVGDMDIEKDWDSYLGELENMKLERYLEIYQEAYDAKWGKK